TAPHPTSPDKASPIPPPRSSRQVSCSTTSAMATPPAPSTRRSTPTSPPEYPGPPGARRRSATPSPPGWSDFNAESAQRDTENTPSRRTQTSKTRRVGTRQLGEIPQQPLAQVGRDRAGCPPGGGLTCVPWRPAPL